ncbi:MAG: response regulator transcription factor [Bacteroidota bacterium]|nr:response regulator transcription factor [Bacteroidota bacterium]
MSKKILLVDDDPDILEFLSFNLSQKGYDVLTAVNGNQGYEKALKSKPDLIILDVMMPESGGIETCKKLRNHKDTQSTLVIFLTARGEDYSQIAGFDAGADDYITKPLKPNVFLSRIAALLKRGKPDVLEQPKKIKIGKLIIDLHKYQVLFNGKEINLPGKEFKLLVLLASEIDKVFTREEIYDKIWGNKVIVGDRTIDVYIRKLRTKISPENIVTVKGVGYKYVAFD